MGALKLNRLPDRTPVKLTIMISPELKRSLDEYAGVYRETYGSDEPIGELVPAIIAAFLDSDRSFQRARGEQP